MADTLTPSELGVRSTRRPSGASPSWDANEDGEKLRVTTGTCVASSCPPVRQVGPGGGARRWVVRFRTHT